MDNRRRMLISGGGFPAEPSAYELIGTYTSSGSFIATEDGWFQVEVFGASGNGGSSAYKTFGPSSNKITYLAGGGGGGGGGYACSRVKLREGDKVTYTVGSVSATSSANISSSVEAYNILQVTSGTSGGAGTATTSSYTGGAGGNGGVATGGNYANNNGGSGGRGNSGYRYADGESSGNGNGGAGGAAGYTGGRVGGKGANVTIGVSPSPGAAGSSGFLKIYRGNTN